MLRSRDGGAVTPKMTDKSPGRHNPDENGSPNPQRQKNRNGDNSEDGEQYPGLRNVTEHEWRIRNSQPNDGSILETDERQQHADSHGEAVLQRDRD